MMEGRTIGDQWDQFEKDVEKAKQNYSDKSKFARSYTCYHGEHQQSMVEPESVSIIDVGKRQLYQITATDQTTGMTHVAFIENAAMEQASTSPDCWEPMLLHALDGMALNAAHSRFREILRGSFTDTDERCPDGPKVYPISADDRVNIPTMMRQTQRSCETETGTMSLSCIHVLQPFESSVKMSYCVMQTARLDASRGSETMVMSCVGGLLGMGVEMNRFKMVSQITPPSLDKVHRTGSIHVLTDGEHFTAKVSYIHDCSVASLHHPVRVILDMLENTKRIPQNNDRFSFMESVYTTPDPIVVLRNTYTPSVSLFIMDGSGVSTDPPDGEEDIVSKGIPTYEQQRSAPHPIQSSMRFEDYPAGVRLALMRHFLDN